jgi:glyoxylate reductase
MAPQFKVFVSRQMPPKAIERLLAVADVTVWPSDSPPPHDELLRQAASVDGIITMLTDRLDNAFFEKITPAFKVISQMAVGTDNIDLKSASLHHIPVGHTPGVLTETCADFTWSLLLTAARRVAEADQEVRQGIWKPWGPDILLGPEVFGATLGIVGMGRIGQAVARRAAGFNMRILYSHPRRLPEVENATHAVYVPLDELLQQSDFISLHTYFTPQTYHMIDQAAFARMKPNAILINTSRGGIVDPQALYDALHEKRILGAALDVFEPEPIPSNHPILALKNVVITPHIASAGIQTRLKMAHITVDNLIAGLNGQKLNFCANPESQK